MQILPPRNAAARNKLRKVLLHGVCALLFCHAEKLVMLPPVRDEARKTDRVGQNAARLPIEKDGTFLFAVDDEIERKKIVVAQRARKALVKGQKLVEVPFQKRR